MNLTVKPSATLKSTEEMTVEAWRQEYAELAGGGPLSPPNGWHTIAEWCGLLGLRYTTCRVRLAALVTSGEWGRGKFYVNGTTGTYFGRVQQTKGRSSK